MATLNANYKRIQGSYLFSEIAKRTRKFKEEHPDVVLFSLGIGNTTQPLPSAIIEGLRGEVEQLGFIDTYTGYGDEQGNQNLRKALGEWYQREGISLDTDEIFISDGAKSDLANVQSIFSEDSSIAIQDPVYPAYVDSSVLYGHTGEFENGKYNGLIYMPCTKDTGFFPDVPLGHADIIYICSPNNPTGAVATQEQLQKFVTYARREESVIIFDAAYSAFIQDDSLPRSIYEIEGAKECAIEINSFSKYAGFTGVRLGWTVVPKALVVEGSKSGEVNKAWNRRQTTMFNGASNIAQAGGAAALSEKGQKACHKIIAYYLANAKIIRDGFTTLGLEVIGGENAPYIWVKTPVEMTSWDFFDTLLMKAHVICTPGVGFGLHGEGYVRLSAFGTKKATQQAVASIQRSVRI